MGILSSLYNVFFIFIMFTIDVVVFFYQNDWLMRNWFICSSLGLSAQQHPCKHVTVSSRANLHWESPHN